MSARTAAPLEGRRAAIIGGGIAGLATAALLASRGADVELFEARDDLGGRVGLDERGGFRWDTGPSWYLMPEVFDHFFALLGTSTEAELDLVDLDPAYRVYSEGRAPLDVRSGREAATALFESVEPGAGARLSAYLDSAGEAYDLAVRRFLYDPYTSTKGLRDPAVLRRLGTLAPLLARTLASKVEASFDDLALRQVLEYPAVFLGGSPYDVPALYHLMSHLDLGDRVGYPRGGFFTLIEAVARVAERHGARLHTGHEVIEVRATDGRRPRARGVRVRDASGTEREVDADIVVGAGDLHHLETALLPESLQTHPEASWDKRTPSPGALLLLLGVKGELPELAHHTLLFTTAWRETFDGIFADGAGVDGPPDPASIYVCRPSATDDTVAPEGHENLFVLVPMAAQPAFGRGGVDGAGDAAVEASADAVIDQIARWTGVDDLAERIVHRRTIAPADFEADLRTWRGNALGLSHTLRQSALFRPKNASAKVDGLFYAGADVLPGIGLPMCLISAELVTKRLLGDDTAARLPEPPRGSASATGSV